MSTGFLLCFEGFLPRRFGIKANKKFAPFNCGLVHSFNGSVLGGFESMNKYAENKNEVPNWCDAMNYRYVYYGERFGRYLKTMQHECWSSKKVPCRYLTKKLRILCLMFQIRQASVERSIGCKSKNCSSVQKQIKSVLKIVDWYEALKKRRKYVIMVSNK